MKKEAAKPNITMYLKHMNDDLYYCMNDPNGRYQPLEENTVTGADGGWVVQWVCADDSITKINKINVNENKPKGNVEGKSASKNCGNVWAIKPKKVDTDGKVFQGTILPGTPNPPIFDGYTIKYTTKDGNKEKDPELQVPQ